MQERAHDGDGSLQRGLAARDELVMEGAHVAFMLDGDGGRHVQREPIWAWPILGIRVGLPADVPD